MIFFPGLHHPGDAKRFRFVCISINRLWRRRKKLGRKTFVLVDSGAFTILEKFGFYPDTHSVERYAFRLWQMHTLGIATILAAVAQDYMCEERITSKTGLTVEEHQRRTIERYDALIVELRRLFKGPIPFHVMPVLQGRTVADYLRHLEMYGDRIAPGMWVGVGSVCKRQGDPAAIEQLLRAIKRARPDLWLHGFGVKLTALLYPAIRRLLATADSMAWSFAAKKVAARLIGRLMRLLGRKLRPAEARSISMALIGVILPDANDWREAKRFARSVRRTRAQRTLQIDLFEEAA